MTISFDLDDTLIPGMKRFPTEPQRFWHKLVSREKLRAGTLTLMKTLKEQGDEVYIYTTSLRSPAYIRRLFLSYGIRLDKVINKTVHDKVLLGQAGRVSKLPSAFGIDLHVDDSPGVEQEGVRFNFRTIIVEEGDEDWANNILRKLKSLQKTN
jgi:FMN phosphatase YigB (HAD superfamily)